MPDYIVAAKKMYERVMSAGEKEKKEEEKIVSMTSYARRSLERRRKELHMQHIKENPKEGEPSWGEQISELSVYDVRMIPVSKIKLDPNFDYIRLNEDPLHPEWSSNEGQHLSDIESTMDEEGIKDPIDVQVVNANTDTEHFLLRAGVRRWKAVKARGWKMIPAFVAPEEIPIGWQYWATVIKNTTRKSLGTYEIATAAKKMRDKFDVIPAEFARRTGLSQGYISNLLGCIDRLPPNLLEQWRLGARVTLDQWLSLSYLTHEGAIAAFRKLTGLTPQERLERAKKRGKKSNLVPGKHMERMQRLWQGIEGSQLPLKTRDLIFKVIEVCMGMSFEIPGVYEPEKQKQYEMKRRLRSELKMPELPRPGEERAMPEPMDMTKEDLELEEIEKDDEDQENDNDNEDEDEGKNDDQS